MARCEDCGKEHDRIVIRDNIKYPAKVCSVCDIKRIGKRMGLL